MIKKNNAQAAFDNMALLGMVLLVAVGVLYYASGATNTNSIYLSDTVQTVENTIESLSNLGDGSADTIVIRTPGGVKTASLTNCGLTDTELCKTMEIVMDSGEEHLFELSYPVWGSLGFFFIPGTHYVTMVNDGDNQRIVFQECGDGLVSGSEQCETCQTDDDCMDLGSVEGTCKIVADEVGYCQYDRNGGCGSNLCRASSDPAGFGCYCECESDLDCPGTTCLADGVCGGCETNNDCQPEEYCSLGNCLNCDQDFDTYNANYNSACTMNPAGWDCNDNEALINPGATEICDDLIDNNCNGEIDEGCNVGCNNNKVCEVGEDCTTCAGDCGGCCPVDLLDYWRVEEGTGTLTTSDNGVGAEFMTYPTGVQEIKWDFDLIQTEPMLKQWAIWFDETVIDDSDDMLRIPMNSLVSDLSSTSSGTLELILDGTPQSGYPGQAIFNSCDSKPLCDGNGMTVYFGEDGTLHARIIKGSSGTLYVDDAGECRNSNYQCYVAITWAKGSTLKMYINNGLVAYESPTNVAAAHIAVLDAPYVFGKNMFPTSSWNFLGKIHQFAFYNKSLTDVEVNASFYTYYSDNVGNIFEGFLCGTGAQCGNGVTEFPEECDDGNLVSTDGCLNDCTLEPLCGNGVVQTPEQCDDGNLINLDGCDEFCMVEPVCGDGFLTPPEQCDDGNLINLDGCDMNCKQEQICGDGIIVAPEQCDGGTSCDVNCNFINNACNFITNYWRFEEEVETVLYDVVGTKDGSVPLDQRYLMPHNSESIVFNNFDDSAYLPIDDLNNGKGSILFYVLLAPVSSTETRLITHDNLIVDIVDIPGNAYEKEIVVQYGSLGNYQTLSTTGAISQLPVDYMYHIISIKWDLSSIELVYSSTAYPLVEISSAILSPLNIDISLNLGSSNGVGSFKGVVDEFALFSEKILTFGEIDEFNIQTSLVREEDAYCGQKVCGDSIVTPGNSLGISEVCDDPLLFGSWGCSRPGTQNLVTDLDDCRAANGPPGSGNGGSNGGDSYCGDGVVETGEVCDPPGSTGAPITVTCGDGNPVTYSPVCEFGCGGFSSPPDICDDRPAGCGDGVLSITEECDPPGTVGNPHLFTCWDGTNVWLNSICTNACVWSRPWHGCPPIPPPPPGHEQTPCEEDPKAECLPLDLCTSVSLPYTETLLESTELYELWKVCPALTITKTCDLNCFCPDTVVTRTCYLEKIYWE